MMMVILMGALGDLKDLAASEEALSFAARSFGVPQDDIVNPI